jgi:ribosomal protein S18 acetylase RimI-like enzyme
MPPPLRAAADHGISYRPMTDGDLPFLAELYASTRREEVAQVGWPAELQEAFLRQQFEAQHSHYLAHHSDAEWLVVERAGAAIGRLYLRETPERFHIVDISLLPESRGQGIGGAILRDVLAAAGDAGKPVSIRVEQFNPARRLYDRLGFRTIAEEGVYDLLEAS